MKRNNTSQTSRDFHPTPFQDPEYSAICCTRSIDANDVRPVHRPKAAGIRSPRARRFPQSEVAYLNSAEEHKHACNNIRRGCDAQRRGPLVRILREEAQRDVLMLQKVWEPISVQEIVVSLIGVSPENKIGGLGKERIRNVMNEVRASVCSASVLSTESR